MAIFALRRAAVSISVAAPLTTLLSVHLIVACSSDSGTGHGSDIPTLPELDGGRIVLKDGGILEPDGAVVAPDDDDDTIDAAPEPCDGSGTAAIVAGNDTTLTGAIRVGGAGWVGGPIAGGAAKSKPSVVALGGAFIGATEGADGSLLALKYTTSWAAPTQIGVGTVKGSPTLATAGPASQGTTHIVYSGGNGANTDYMHGIYDGTNWDAASELVGTAGPPAEHSFGTTSAGLAGLADGSLVFVENGGDHGLYARTWDSTNGWIKSIPVNGAGSVGQQGATPEVLAVGGGTYDVVFVYADNNTPGSGGAPIAWATHTITGDIWGTPNQAPHEIGSTAQTTQKMAAVLLNDTTILLSFVSNTNAYYTVGTVVSNATDPGQAVTWTTPAAIGGGTPIQVDSVAAVAKGICGNDAIFAFAVGGGVRWTTVKGLSGTATWRKPEAVPGALGNNVAIATMLP